MVSYSDHDLNFRPKIPIYKEWPEYQKNSLVFGSFFNLILTKYKTFCPLFKSRLAWYHIIRNSNGSVIPMSGIQISHCIWIVTVPCDSPLHVDVDQLFLCIRDHQVVNRVSLGSNDLMFQVLVHVLRQERGEGSKHSHHRVQHREQGILDK